MDPEVKIFFDNVKTGIVTDAMHLLGIEGWMTDILPLKKGAHIFGPAFTVQGSPYRGKQEKNYMICDLAEMIQPGDIMVFDGLGSNCSSTGEKMMQIVQRAGAGGVVLNGHCRDFDEICALQMPVFGLGPAIRMRYNIFWYTEYNVNLRMAGAQVHPGDYILGDCDGVLVIPADRLLDIKKQAELVIEVEEELDRAIAAGVSVPELKKIMQKKRTPRP